MWDITSYLAKVISDLQRSYMIGWVGLTPAENFGKEGEPRPPCTAFIYSRPSPRPSSGLTGAPCLLKQRYIQ